MRVDGRAHDKLRVMQIHRNYTKYAEGSVLIELGHTQVICTASVEEGVPPFLRNTNTGWITAEYSMLPRATEMRTPREASRGRLTGRTQEIQRLIGRALRAVTRLDLMGEVTIWIDCDVIQADGGTRTASITGGYVALVDALAHLKEVKSIDVPLLTSSVAAVSVGIVGGEIMIDLCYAEDANAWVDMNIVMTGHGKIVEIQGTAEAEPFSIQDLQQMLSMAKSTIGIISAKQRDSLGEVLWNSVRGT